MYGSEEQLSRSVCSALGRHRTPSHRGVRDMELHPSHITASSSVRRLRYFHFMYFDPTMDNIPNANIAKH